MDLLTLIGLVKEIPGVGPWLGPVVSGVASVVLLATAVSPFVPAPALGASWPKHLGYEVLQWCALNKGQATNLLAPVNQGRVAGPGALVTAKTK